MHCDRVRGVQCGENSSRDRDCDGCESFDPVSKMSFFTTLAFLSTLKLRSMIQYNLFQRKGGENKESVCATYVVSVKK